MGVGTRVPKLQPRGVGGGRGDRPRLPAVLGRPCELRTVFRFLKSWGVQKKTNMLRRKDCREVTCRTIKGLVLAHFTLVCLLIVAALAFTAARGTSVTVRRFYLNSKCHLDQ